MASTIQIHMPNGFLFVLLKKISQSCQKIFSTIVFAAPASRTT